MKIAMKEMPKDPSKCYFSVFMNGQYRCTTKKLPECNLKKNATECHLLELFEQVKDDCK